MLVSPSGHAILLGRSRSLLEDCSSRLHTYEDGATRYPRK
jgi:hypothetical protein